MLADPRSYFGTDAADKGIFMQHQRLSGCCHDVRDGGVIQRQQGPKVQYSDGDAGMSGGVIEGPMDTGAIGNNRKVVTVLYYPGLPDLDLIVRFGHGTADTAVKRLMFEIQDGIRIVDGGDQ